MKKNPRKIVKDKPVEQSVCEVCKDKELGIPVEHRCTNCDLWMCHECWEMQDGNDESKNCPECPGVLYK